MKQLNVVMLTGVLYYGVVLILCSQSVVSVPVDGDAGPAFEESEEQMRPRPEKRPLSPFSESKPVAGPVNTTQPKLNDYQESSKKYQHA